MPSIVSGNALTALLRLVPITQSIDRSSTSTTFKYGRAMPKSANLVL